MLLKKLFILLLLQLQVLLICAQENVDTLLQMLDNHKKEDTTRLLIWATLAKEYLKVDLSKSLSASDTVIRLAQKLKLPGWEANAYNAKASVYFDRGEYSLALQYILRALDMAKQINHKRRISQSTGNVGSIYFVMGDYANALNYFQKGLDLAKEINEKDLIASYNSDIGAIYVEMANYPKALEYVQKSIRLKEEIKEEGTIRADFVIMAKIYSELNDYNKAIDYCKKSLQIDEKNGDKKSSVTDLNSLANILESSSEYSQAIEYRLKALSIGREMGLETEVMNTLTALELDYAKISDYSRALEFSLQAQKLSEKIGDNTTGGLQWINLGYIYANAPPSIIFSKGFDSAARYEQALNYFNKGLKAASERKKVDYERDAWKNISDLYKKQGNYVEALNAYHKYIILRDSILNNEKRKEITRKEIEYEFNNKEDSLKLQQQITDEKLKQQVLLSKQQLQQLEINKKVLDLSNKEKDLQTLAYLKTQVDLRNEQLQKQQKIKQLSISEKEKQLQSSQLTTLSQEKKLNALTQQRLWLLAAGGFCLVVFTALFFLYRTRLRQVQLASQLAQQKNEQQVKEAEFAHKLGDITLSALRSQMNPHFIFNCLNSIKLYAAQNDSKAASDYLTKFSRLIRQMLENSRSERISLTSEIHALELYIQMEAMRFKEKLKYQISIDKNIDAEYVEIPPLLIQPYVENAIWHGLMQKEEGGMIDVHIGSNGNDDILLATVTDNGIGRKKALELKSKSATKHKSYGMKVTSERIALINQVYNSNTTVSVTDLYNESGEPTGTKVVIEIPI